MLSINRFELKHFLSSEKNLQIFDLWIRKKLIQKINNFAIQFFPFSISISQFLFSFNS